MKRFKLIISIFSLLFILCPLLTSASTREHQYMTSFINKTSTSAKASMVSHGPGVYYKVSVYSEISNGSTVIRRHENVSHSGKYGSSVSASVGPNATVRNGSGSSNGWEYYYTNCAVWY